jgi:hypothetical protein
MVSCFLKRVGEEGPKVFVEKFLERAWVREDGAASILRTVVLGCREGGDITGFGMMIPSNIEASQVTDLTSTGLSPEFFWNHKESNTFQIIDEQKRTIRYDGIDPIVVPSHLMVDVKHIGSFSLLGITFNRDIHQGEHVFVRLRLDECRFATTKSDGDLLFNHAYLSSDGVRQALVDMTKLQIPVIPLLNEDTRAGGFDVFVTSPPDMRIAAEPHSHNVPTKGVTDIEGKPIDSRTSRCWRLRFETARPTEPMLAAATGLDVVGDIVKDTIWIRLQELAKALRRAEILGYVSILLALIALILALAK